MKNPVFALACLAFVGILLVSCAGGPAPPAVSASTPAASVAEAAPVGVKPPVSAPAESVAAESAAPSAALPVGESGLTANERLLALIGQHYTEAQALIGTPWHFIDYEGGTGNGLYFDALGLLALTDGEGTVVGLQGDIAALMFNSGEPVSYERLCLYFEQTPALEPHGGVAGFSTDGTTFIGSRFRFYVGFTQDAASGQYLSDFMVVSRK